MLLGRILLVGGTLVLVAGVGILFRALVHHRPYKAGLILAPVGLILVVLGLMQPNANYMATNAAGAQTLWHDVASGRSIKGKTLTFRVTHIEKSSRQLHLSGKYGLEVTMPRGRLADSLSVGDRVTVQCAAVKGHKISGKMQ